MRALVRSLCAGVHARLRGSLCAGVRARLCARLCESARACARGGLRWRVICFVGLPVCVCVRARARVLAGARVFARTIVLMMRADGGEGRLCRHLETKTGL